MFRNVWTYEQVQMICNNDRCGIEQNRHSLPVRTRPPVTILGGRMAFGYREERALWLMWAIILFLIICFGFMLYDFARLIISLFFIGLF